MFRDEGCGITYFGSTACPIPPVSAEATCVVARNGDDRDGIKGFENGHFGPSSSQLWEKKRLQG